MCRFRVPVTCQKQNMFDIKIPASRQVGTYFIDQKILYFHTHNIIIIIIIEKPLKYNNIVFASQCVVIGNVIERQNHVSISCYCVQMTVHVTGYSFHAKSHNNLSIHREIGIITHRCNDIILPKTVYGNNHLKLPKRLVWKYLEDFIICISMR